MEHRTPAAPPKAPSARWLLLAAALALTAFYSVGETFLDGYLLDLGSLGLLTPRYVYFVAFWTLFGGLAVVLLALGAARLCGSEEAKDAFDAQWNALSDRRFLVWTCAVAVGLPLLLRFGLMRGAPLADDGGAYRFAAQLLASGRLWVASPELKFFFDQNFMINDGRLFPAYFFGWPALLAPGVWIGATWIVNPLCSALTVPPLAYALRHFVGTAWARAGVLLFLSAPFIQIAAATDLAHTSCLMALTWCLAMYLRTRERGASVQHHAGFALSFALAFCIRPQSAVPIGLPLLVAWGLALRHRGRGERLKTLVAGALPAAILAILLLASLQAQNGSPWRTGYAHFAEYLVDNEFQFTTFGPDDLTAVVGFDFSHLGAAVARTATGLARMNFDLFGWPSSFLLLLPALPGRSRHLRLLWAMIGWYLLLHLFQSDWGIDTFGPTHAFELALPVVILSAAGAHNLGRRLAWAPEGNRGVAPWRWCAFPPALFGALITVAWLGFVPVRLSAIRQIATHINQALQAPERAGLHNAVVFSPFPFAPLCDASPRHFVFFHPINDPDLENDILWVNHIDREADRQLVASLPGRTGYVLRWTRDCRVDLTPLENLGPGELPPGPRRLGPPRS